MTVPSSRLAIADEALRRGLARMVGRRVPSSEVDDIVQTTLAEALTADSVPDDPSDLRRWLWGIARHKIVDAHRRRGRETYDVPELASQPPSDARDLLRWAERELPQGPEHAQTLEWMLREADGEELDTIAKTAQLPAPRVRQRVSRMRRFLRARWIAQCALLLLLMLIIVGLYVWRQVHSAKPIAPAPQSEWTPSLPAGDTFRPAPSASVLPRPAPEKPSPPEPKKSAKPSKAAGKRAATSDGWESVGASSGSK